MSKQYETDVVNDINRSTPDHIKAYPCGDSGNHATPSPDVLITYSGGMNHALELKGPIHSERCYTDKDDLEQLVKCQGPNTAAYLVVKFANRQPVVVRYYDSLTSEPDGWADYTDAEKMASLFPECFNANSTPSDTLSVGKPDTDGWLSATAAPDDYVTILDGCGIETERSRDIDLSL